MKRYLIVVFVVVMVAVLLFAQGQMSKEEIRIQKLVDKVIPKGPESIAELFYKMREDENQKVCETIINVLIADYRSQDEVNREDKSFKLVDFLNALHFEHGAVRPSTTTYACSLVVSALDADERAEVYQLLDPNVQRIFSGQVAAHKLE